MHARPVAKPTAPPLAYNAAMSHTAAHVPVQVALSNANFADPRVMHKHGLLTPEAMGEFAQSAGYDGVEWMPVWPVVGTQRRIARAVNSQALVLTSLCAGFADEHPLEAPEPNGSFQARLLASPAGRLAVVSVQRSPQWMDDLQLKLTNTNPPLDQVRYPVVPAPIRGSAHTAMAGPAHGRMMLQPTDWVARALGANTSMDLALAAKRQGFDQSHPFALDTHHVRRHERGVPAVVSTLRRSLPSIAKQTGEVHLSLARFDLPEGMDTYMMEVEARRVMQGTGTFPNGLEKLLVAPLQLGNVRRIVVEAPAQHLERLTGTHTTADIRRIYAAIADSVRILLAN